MLSFRKPSLKDIQLYYDWATDQEVREQSYNSNPISQLKHKSWFTSAIANEAYYMYIFQDLNGNNVGQVRIQKQTNKAAVIGISVDSKYRGKGHAKEMLVLATNDFFECNEDFLINAYIKHTNLNSKSSFVSAGFQFIDVLNYENHKSFHFIKAKK